MRRALAGFLALAALSCSSSIAQVDDEMTDSAAPRADVAVDAADGPPPFEAGGGA